MSLQDKLTKLREEALIGASDGRVNVSDKTLSAVFAAAFEVLNLQKHVFITETNVGQYIGREVEGWDARARAWYVGLLAGWSPTMMVFIIEHPAAGPQYRAEYEKVRLKK